MANAFTLTGSTISSAKKPTKVGNSPYDNALAGGFSSVSQTLPGNKFTSQPLGPAITRPPTGFSISPSLQAGFTGQGPNVNPSFKPQPVVSPVAQIAKPVGTTPGLLNSSPTQKQPVIAKTPAPTPAPTAAVTQPITGNVTTPSGAVVNATTGQQVGGTQNTTQNTTQGTQQQNTPTFQNTVGGLIQSAQGQGPTNPAAQAATEKLAGIEKNIGELRGQLGQNQAGYLTGGLTSPVAMGRAQVLGQTEAAQEQGLGLQEQAIQNQLKNELAAQQQGTAGLTTAAGLLAPQQNYPFVFNPATGQYTNAAGGTGGVVSPEQVAQDVASGRMGYSQGKSALSYLGGTAEAQLQQAIKSINPNFNFAQADTLAQQQGSIGPNLQYADAAFKNLEDAFSKLKVPGQQTSSGLLSGLGAGISGVTTYGATETKNLMDAAAEARTAIAAVLASVKGGTPTDYSGQAHTLIPDVPTAADIAAAKSTLQTLGAARQNIYGQPGGQGAQPTGAQSVQFNPDGTLQSVSF